MARRKVASVDDNDLTKGQLRKLNALRKSLGDDIAEKAFKEWLAKQPAGDSATPETDPVADRISKILFDLVEKEKLQFPRGGYNVRRGRGRVIVEATAQDG